MDADPTEQERRLTVANTLVLRLATRDGVSWVQREADIEAALDAVWDALVSDDDAVYDASLAEYHSCFARLNVTPPA